jgi:hypothetical protein
MPDLILVGENGGTRQAPLFLPSLADVDRLRIRYLYRSRGMTMEGEEG